MIPFESNDIYPDYVRQFICHLLNVPARHNHPDELGIASPERQRKSNHLMGYRQDPAFQKFSHHHDFIITTPHHSHAFSRNIFTSFSAFSSGLPDKKTDDFTGAGSTRQAT